MSPRVRFASVCTAVWSSSKSPAVFCLAALLARPSIYALSNWPLLGVYLEEKNWLFLGDADAGQRSAILYTIFESCRCRSIDPYACLRDVLARPSSMTNWQVKHVTPEAGRKLPVPCDCDRRIVRTITVIVGYDIYDRNIRTMSLWRLA